MKEKPTPPAAPSASNPLGIKREDYGQVRDICLLAGAALQRFKPGGLTAMADIIDEDLKQGKALLLSTINRRRGQKFSKLLRAAEEYRRACAELVLILDMVDPEEKQ